MNLSLRYARPAALAVGLAALLGAMQAQAADVIMEEPPAPAAPMEEPPLNTWTGPYAGVSVGYGFAGETNDRTFANSIDTDGFVAGAFAGYNYQFDRVVAGIEGDVGYSWMDGSNAGTTSESGIEGSLRARLGYAVMPDVLLYATAGGAAKNLEVSALGTSDTNAMLGWTAGAGADVKITEKMFGRVEYRYTDFGAQDFTTGLGTSSVEDKDHRVTFGLGVQF